MAAPQHDAVDVPAARGATLWRLAPLSAMDPSATLRGDVLWASWRTPDGPATLCARAAEGRVEGWAWGPGATRALAALPALAGALDDPTPFQAQHPAVRALQAASPGLRLARQPWTVEALLRIVLQQRVRFEDAARSWRALVYAWGEPAPGPWDDGDHRVRPLLLPPDPRRLARVDPDALRPFEIDRSRARTLVEVARAARHVADLAHAPQEAPRVLAALPGVGPWTSGSFLGGVLGDPDAVPLGDVHLPRWVSHMLADPRPPNDDVMTELLRPWSGHRQRVVRLLLLNGARVLGL